MQRTYEKQTAYTAEKQHDKLAGTKKVLGANCTQHACVALCASSDQKPQLLGTGLHN